MTTNREISFNIRHKIGILAVYQSGWRKEVNLVEWNGGPANVDIRDWDPSHQHMGKGVTLRPEEAGKLQWVLYRYFTGRGGELLNSRQTEQEQPAGAEPAEIPRQAAEIPTAQEAEEGLFCGQDCMLDVDLPFVEELAEEEALQIAELSGFLPHAETEEPLQ